MTDFAYDSYDRSTIKTAFENLRRAEERGFYAGVFAIPSVYIASKAFKWNLRPTSAVLVPLFAGSLM